jgi:hypothetical protein
LQTVPAREQEPRKGVAQCAGFSLHAGIGVEPEQREKLERLTRYVSRLPVAIERLDLLLWLDAGWPVFAMGQTGGVSIVYHEPLANLRMRARADLGTFA